ncbi:MAG: acetate--CoA ligase family protein [Candidatus Methanoperedens sp.]|nr:acetate--CoA ligase family protein [Candidatus Methanoperedens sp.]
MKLYEYDAKEIFKKNSILVPEGSLVLNPDDAQNLAEKLGTVVIKAQVMTGGRGKAGGITKASNPKEAYQSAQRILGMSVKGFPVNKILVEEYKKPDKEMYIGITIDRAAKCPLIMVSPEGGIDIEEIAKTSPQKIVKMRINLLTGMHDYQARMLANSLNKDKPLMIADIIKKLYHVFIANDCTLAEINPLADTKDGIFALDAKMIIDDNALFRQDFREEETGSHGNA